MEETNMNEMNSYKNIKKYNSLLPNIRYNNTSRKEISKKQFNGINNESNLNNSQFNNNKILFEKEKVNNFNHISYTPFNNDHYSLRKYNSQMNLFNEDDNNDINNILNEEEDFDNFSGKIKIYNYYSSSEIISLIEIILDELNFEKNYSFNIKDSLITFSFGNANKALAVFKKLNMEKLNNKYYRNLIIDINLDLKGENNKIKAEEKIMDKLNEEDEKVIFKKIIPQQKKLKKIKDIKKSTNFKSYNFNFTKDNPTYKNFEGIYRDYLEYFKNRKEERRKKELSYINGKNYSLQASTPYVENDNRNFFVENLRKYKGKFISPNRFNGFIDKASRHLI